MSEIESEYITEHQIKLNASGKVLEPGKFEVICITAGNGNGWDFPADVLKASLALWEGAHCFIDHAWFSRSLRDLAGQVLDPVWDEDANGIRATLKAFGPGGEVLTAFGREVTQEDNPPKVGFSADVLFTANGKKVKQILRVQSVDLVYNPARGGAFLRALNSLDRLPAAHGVCQNQEVLAQTNIANGGNTMPEPEVKTTQETPEEPALAKLQQDQEAMRQMLGEQERQTKLEKALEEAQKTRIQMCEYLLESGLNASKLPNPVQARIRAQFKGKIFEAAELQVAIEDSRTMLSELTAGQTVAGPGRISSMFNEQDKLQAAVDDLFDAPREEKLKSLDVPNLTGVRELYLMLTGDRDLHGGFYPDRVQLATTSDFTGLVKNALNKIVINTWEQLGRAGYNWWQNIAVTEHFNSLQSITGTLIGTVGDLPVVAEGGAYTELSVGDSPETASFIKYGGYIPLTLELIDRDETRKLKAYAREMASAGLRKVSSLVAAIFTANAGVGPVMADTANLFNADPSAVLGGHANLLTTALDITAWEAACQAVYNQPMLIKNDPMLAGTGPKMAINPKFCLVPRPLQYTASQMLQGDFVREATYVYDNILKGSAVPITVPEWTDANNWAAACDPRIAPAIYVGERFGIMPEIFVAGDELSPAVFTNDQHRLKVRHFLAVWVNDFRPLHKSNVL